MYLVVEGPIGVGKTSLAERLARRYGAELSLEIFEENPFLARFYTDPAAFAFQVQVFFLLSRFKQLSALGQAGLFGAGRAGGGADDGVGSVVSDYLFAKDFIFAAMNLGDHEFALYQDLYVHLSPRLPVPDLVVYLRAEPELLLARTRKRGRTYEAGMQAAYLAELTRRYDEYFQTYAAQSGGRLLTVDAGTLDFVGDADHEARLLHAVEEALRGPPGLTPHFTLGVPLPPPLLPAPVRS